MNHWVKKIFIIFSITMFLLILIKILPHTLIILGSLATIHNKLQLAWKLLGDINKALDIMPDLIAILALCLMISWLVAAIWFYYESGSFKVSCLFGMFPIHCVIIDIKGTKSIPLTSRIMLVMSFLFILPPIFIKLLPRTLLIIEIFLEFLGFAPRLINLSNMEEHFPLLVSFFATILFIYWFAISVWLYHDLKQLEEKGVKVNKPFWLVGNFFGMHPWYLVFRDKCLQNNNKVRS